MPLHVLDVGLEGDTLLKSDKQSSALQEAEGTSVANGKAYGICSCSGEEREDTPKCFVEQTNPEQLSITCKDGYSLEVRPLLIGKTRVELQEKKIMKEMEDFVHFARLLWQGTAVIFALFTDPLKALWAQSRICQRGKSVLLQGPSSKSTSGEA